jgi:ComF family protein
MRYLIRRWKFERATHLTRTLRKLFLSETSDQLPEVDILVPTPLHWRRQLSRGFNQSELIAKAIGRQLGTPVLNALKRQKYSTPQHKTRHRADRQLDEHHFLATQQLPGLRVALIDDVITTGSTANAASKSLLNAGADKVQLWCLARTPYTGTP